MTTDLTKLNQFAQIGTDLIVELTGEVSRIRKDLEKKYPPANVPADLSKKENYQLVKTAIKDIKNPRITLEKDRKRIKETPLSVCKMIDDAARPEREALEKLELPWVSAKKDFDIAREIAKREAARKEEERVQSIVDRIAVIKALPGRLISDSSAAIATAAQTLRNDGTPTWAREWQDKAETAIFDTLKALDNLYDMQLAAENKTREEEAERIRAEKEEQEKIAAQTAENARIAKEQEEQQRELDKERAVMADERRKIEADKNRIEEEKRQVRIREQQEQQRKEAERRRAEEEKKRKDAEDKQRLQREKRRKLNIEEAVNDLREINDFMPENSVNNFTPNNIINHIIKGGIRHLKFED